MAIRFLSLLVLLSCYQQFAIAESYSQIGWLLGDSEIYGPPYKEIVTDLKRLESEFPQWVEVKNYGKSVLGNDLKAILLSKRGMENSVKEDRPAILITGATHGNEYLNIADRLPRWFAENASKNKVLQRFFNKGGQIYIVPIVNPDGYEARQRRNAENVDLNRDFEHFPTKAKNFTQKETKSLAYFIDKTLSTTNSRLLISMDYHCCVGSWLYPWAYSASPLDRFDLDAHQELLEKVKDHFPGYYYGTYKEVLDYFAWGTSTDYFYSKYGTLSFIFEGARGTENENFSGHTAMWTTLLEEITRP